MSVNIAITTTETFNLTINGQTITQPPLISKVQIRQGGDSIAAGFNSSDAPNAGSNYALPPIHQSIKAPIYLLVNGLLDPAIYFDGFDGAVGGTTIVQMLGWDDTKIFAGIDKTTYQNWLMLCEGGLNDLLLGGSTPAQLYANQILYHAMAQNRGWKTIAYTLDASNYTTNLVGNPTYPTAITNTQYETKRLTYNAMVRAGWKTDLKAVGLFDVGADPIYGTFGSFNPTYIGTDGLHPTDTGYADIAAKLVSVIQGVIANGTYGIVTPIPPPVTTGFVPVVLAQTSGITVTSTDYIGAGGGVNGYTNKGLGALKLPLGIDGEVRATFSSTANNSAIIGLSKLDQMDRYNSGNYQYGFLTYGNTMNKWDGGTAQGGAINGTFNGVTFNPFGIIRLKVTGSVVTCEISYDNGVTFAILFGFTTQRTTDLYLVLNIDNINKLSNLQTLNFI